MHCDKKKKKNNPGTELFATYITKKRFSFQIYVKNIRQPIKKIYLTKKLITL